MQYRFVDRRRLGLVALGAIIAVLFAGPISLLLTSLLLPGDPDDPNAKAFALGVAAAVPAALAGVGVYAVATRVLRTGREGRATLAAHVRTAIPLAVAGFLLLLAWPVAFATPAPETAEQATGSPYLWRDGAVRMAAVALTLLVFSAALALARKARSRRHDLPPARV